MTYNYENWILYKKDIVLKSNYIETLYFFSKRKPSSGIPSDLPDGFQVIINKRTCLPVII
jgi:hypothetical protein